MLRRMVSTICLMILFQSVIIAADAQDPRAQRIKQRLDESGQYFRQGDLLMGANRVSEAASLLKASPGAMPNTTPQAHANCGSCNLFLIATEAKSTATIAVMCDRQHQIAAALAEVFSICTTPIAL